MGRDAGAQLPGDWQKGGAELSLDGLLTILRRNHSHLGADPAARAFQERLQAEYAASLGMKYLS